jgi:regulator of protease activity HflC (stomatin/prohibitin superfamily)
MNTQNKKGGKVIAGLVLGLAFLLLTLIVFAVDTTEYAVVTQFGNPVAVIKRGTFALRAWLSVQGTGAEREAAGTHSDRPAA